MKIVNIIGGIGNQMFQYAFAVSLKEKYPSEKVFVDTQHYKNAIVKKFRGNNFYHNGYEIGKVFPNASIKSANALILMKISYYIPNQLLYRFFRRFFPKRKSEFLAYEEPYRFLPTAINIKTDCYYDGYWMSPKYFDKIRKEILRVFTFSPFNTQEKRKYERLLVKDNSVTIHIRRGDYVGGKNLGGICTLDYYRNAIDLAREKIKDPIFFVFSNDQEWCLENLKKEFEDSMVYFVNNNKGLESYRDMQLMSLARCNILANSSFSWWGSYLNQREDHVAFCPKKWHNAKDYSDHFVDGWIKVDIHR